MSTVKKSLIGGAVGLALLGAAGGAGFFYGHERAQPALAAAEERAGALDAELSETRASHATELEEVRRELSDTHRQARLLEARRQLALSLDEIDARNFGLAEQHSRRAAAQLELIESDRDVAALARQLAANRLDASGNFDESRQELRGLARTLDRLVATRSRTPSEAAPAPATEQGS